MTNIVKFSSVAAALGFLSCGSVAQAADLPLRTAPPTFTAPVLVNNWDGLYAGSTFGYGFTQFDTRQTASHKVSASGQTGGGLIGYNFQTGHFVYGAEGGIDLNIIRKSQGGTPGVAPTSIDSLYDIRLRGRLGYEFGWFMPFVSGGAVINETYQSQVAPINYFGQNKQSVGYTVGAGVDVKFNPAQVLHLDNSFINGFLGPMILRLEYIHDELPSSTYTYGPVGGLQTFRTKSDSNIVRAAIISRFGDMPPRPYVDKMGDVNWAGAYGGVFGGGSTLSAKTAGAVGGGKTKLNSSGALGGLYAGTNFMIYNRVMLGFEGSTAYTDISGHGAEPTGPASFRNYVQADLRGRAGYAFGNVLPFAAAGVVFGRSEQVDQATGSQRGRVNSEAWTVGAGIDYRISERISLRGEYLYLSSFQDKLVSLNGCATCKQSLDGNIFRIGAAYHFE